MLHIRRTDKAEEDILEIWSYLALDNIKAADTLLRRLDEVVRLLARYPLLGVSQDKFRPGLRCIAAGSYLVFYDYDDDEVRILRILHASRRWNQLLG